MALIIMLLIAEILIIISIIFEAKINGEIEKELEILEERLKRLEEE